MEKQRNMIFIQFLEYYTINLRATYSFLLCTGLLLRNSLVNDRRRNCNLCSNKTMRFSSSSINFCSSATFSRSALSFSVLLSTAFCLVVLSRSHSSSIRGIHCKINSRPFWYAFNLLLKVVPSEKSKIKILLRKRKFEPREE